LATFRKRNDNFKNNLHQKELACTISFADVSKERFVDANGADEIVNAAADHRRNDPLPIATVSSARAAESTRPMGSSTSIVR
jgi:hypothetical protein